MTSRSIDRRLAVAPMMDWTDRHCRWLMRAICPQVLLYTEMVTASAVNHGDAGRLLRHDRSEHPVAVQLGGSEPGALAAAARTAASMGYDEINLNCGCPSDRVQSGRFGACLMAEPLRVAECIDAMRAAVSVPVTVKCRTGIDTHADWEHFIGFIDTIAAVGCDTFIVHARMAWLDGLSPKQNRELPPLDYDRVMRLKRERPGLTVVLNGGLRSVGAIESWLPHFDGVMLGRAAYHDPWLLAELTPTVYGMEAVPRSRHAIVRSYMGYMARELESGTPLNAMTRHMLGLFQSRPGARAWRRHLSEQAHKPGAGVDVVERALDKVPELEDEVAHPLGCADA